MNLHAELNLGDTNIPSELRKFLIWKNKFPRFIIINNYTCKVTHWFNKDGEPHNYREYCEPLFNLYVINNGILIVHENEYSHTSSDGYRYDRQRVYFIKTHVEDYK